jgi:hypothetical protein
MLPDSCTIVMVSDADIKAHGLTSDIALRHEIAHCNGYRH